MTTQTSPETPANAEKTLDLSKMTLDQCIDEELRYSAISDKAEAERKQYKGEILKRLTAEGFQVGQAYVRGDGVSVNIQTKAGSDKIDRAKLILAGVDEDIVNNATIKGQPGAPFIVARLPKTKKEDFILGNGTGTDHLRRG